MKTSRPVRPFRAYVITALFYLTFVTLYLASLDRIWVHRIFLIDAAVPDAGIMTYKRLYGPVIGLGGLLVLELILLAWTPWMRRILCLSHAVLGITSLAYCAWIWNDVNQTFNFIYTTSWPMQAAELGPGYYLFVCASVVLSLSGLCSLRTLTAGKRTSSA